ncbi:MAG: endonuclease III [Bdellovibrio sp.]
MILAKAPKKRPVAEPELDVILGLKLLEEHYPGAHCELHHNSPYQLLVATLLSAQCTDERVNRVTPELFKRAPNPQAMSQLPRSEVEALIRPTGFFKTKAKHLQELSIQLLSRHEGRVPEDLEALTALPGVGRKTAQVVLGNCFRQATGIVVDTHVRRLSQRWGWSRAHQPEKIEKVLCQKVPRSRWIALSHEMIFHGRRICQARKPRCQSCFLFDHCPRLGVR